MGKLLRPLATADGLVVLAMLCLLLAMDRLAGLWWAVLTAAPLLAWMAWVAHLTEQTASKAGPG